MGKSPGKWIKKVLFGKKESKSKSPKPRQVLRSASEGTTTLTSTKVSVSNVATNQPLVPKPVLGTSASTKENRELEKGETAECPTVEVILSARNIDNGEEVSGNISTVKDAEGMSLEQAAAKVQAAVRGYQARTKYQSLKLITRLQAVARGHLVRRQAVVSLHSMRGIIKFQALVRGQRIRHSIIGREMHRKESRGELDGQCLNFSDNIVSERAEKLLGTAFVCKLLSLLPAAMPLQLHYEPEEPNSLWNWLNRWTRLHIRGPHSQPKQVIHVIEGSSLTGGTNQARPKGSVSRLPSSDMKNSSKRCVLESEKLKGQQMKVTKDPVKSIQEQPKIGIKKVHRNLKNISNPAVESSKPVGDSQRRNHTRKKSLNTDYAEEISNPVEKVAEATEKAVPKPFDVETSPELAAEEGTDHELHNQSNCQVQPKEAQVQPKGVATPVNKEFGRKDIPINDENRNSNKRRASLPAKHDYSENGLHDSPRVPSYMATTESAKAKLRAQAFSNFGQQDSEKDALARRHSLPSSRSGNFSSSPRVHRLVQASLKGGARGDRSLMSSRDSSDSRLIQADWKR